MQAMERGRSFMGRVDLFIAANQDINAHVVKVPTSPCGGDIAIVCDSLGKFTIPKGLSVSKEGEKYYLQDGATPQFLEIIHVKNEQAFKERRYYHEDKEE